MKDLKKVIVGIIIIFTLCVIVYLSFVANDVKQYAVFSNVEVQSSLKAKSLILILKHLVLNILGTLPS